MRKSAQKCAQSDTKSAKICNFLHFFAFKKDALAQMIEIRKGEIKIRNPNPETRNKYKITNENVQNGKIGGYVGRERTQGINRGGFCLDTDTYGAGGIEERSQKGELKSKFVE